MLSKFIELFLPGMRKKRKMPEPQSNPGVITVTPTSGVMPLKTMDDWRALFHQIVPVIVTALVGANIVTEGQVALWIPLVFAIADPILSIANTQDKIRKIIYGLLAALQAGSGLTALVEVVANNSSPVVAPAITAGGAIISGILANFFTPTSNMVPKTRIGVNVNDVMP